MNGAPARELQSIGPDLIQITRLFGLPDDPCDGRGAFSFDLDEDAEGYVCRFRGPDGAIARRVPFPEATGDARVDALHRRRACRRLCRQTLYDLCRERTGIHPPWGSLTGIRPTRLIWEQVERGLSTEAAEAAVIRDFDVTPEKARLLRETVEVQQTLPPPDPGRMDVYIGIPFCTTRCAYCSFSSGELGDGRLVEPYLEALLGEMEAGAALMRRTGHRLRALYVGGGTPTSLNAGQLARLLGRIGEIFPGAAEVTVEAGRPDTLDAEKLRVIRAAKADRISINPQTMNERTLRVIGRAHTPEQIERAYALAREAGIGHINMDVIAGLPGEGTDDFRRTMDAALRLRPESLTVHALAIKRSTRMHLEGAPLPPRDVAAAMTEMGRETAAEMGMRPYYLYRQKNMAGSQENVGYALPGHACLYNVDIMEEHTHILAFGAGAISKRVYPEEGRIGRAPNVSNIEQYIARAAEMAERKVRLFEGPDDPRDAGEPDEP